jgi:hypothetical protein
MTKNRYTSRAIWTVAIFVAAYFFLTIKPARAQLDETCKVMINNQTVQVGFGGEFRIRNIPAGNNLLRIYAICTKGGKTRYGRSVFYQVQNRQTITLSELDFVWRDRPFPTTAAIQAVPDTAILSQIGLTTQIRVTATFSDSTKKDVTARGFGSTYTSSNASVASVDLQGRVTATGIGTALITVNNEGATAVTRITVAPPTLLTTVEGIVQLENGSPAVGATVVVPGFGETIVTDPGGRFAFTGVFTQLGSLKARAYNMVNNQLLLGITGNLRLIAGGITDAGIIVIKPVTNFVYWKDAVSGAWTEAARWNTGVVPTANDNVFIGVPGNVTVTYSTGTTTVRSLLCDESFTLSAGSFAVSDSSEMTGVFTFSGGTLAGSGAVTIFGALTWSGGTMAAGGSTNIAASGLMDLSTATAKTSNRTINNFGTTTVSGVGNFNISSGSSFNNQVGGNFAIGSDGNILGNGSFNNMGTLRKTGATGITSFNGPRFNNNSGTIDLLTGTLNLISGGTSTGGIFTVAAGATLGFNGGTHVFSGAYAGSGAGLTQLTNGTIQISTSGASFNFTGSGFRVSGGALTGPGLLTNLGTFAWTGGNISGQVIIANTGAFNISGSSVKDFIGGATINNASTVTWAGTGQIRGGGSAPGSVFNNLAGATFNIRDNSSWAGVAFGGTPTTFNNSGTIIKSDSSGAATLSVHFNNTGGAINVQTGALTISLTSNYSGGTFNIASGATLNLSGTHVFSGSHSGLIEGLIQIGTLQIDAMGTIFNFGGKGFTWTSGNIVGPGALTNTGLFSISGISVKDFTSGTFNNAGTVTWTGRGQIRGGGTQVAVFNNLAGATFNIRDNSSWAGSAFGGTPTAFNNSGTVVKSDSSGTATLSVRFNNTGGTIDVQSGTLALTLGGNGTSGIFTAANGANLNFSGGTHIFSGAYSGSVAGSVQLTGGTLQIDTSRATFNFTGSGFRVNGGALTGPGILTNIGTFDLTNGSISNQAIIANTGTFNITGSSLKDFVSRAIINNTGTVTWIGTGQIRGGTGSVFNNLANGTFDIQVDAFFNGNVFGGTRTAFNNIGVVIKSAGTGTATLEVTFNNANGTIGVQTGTLALSAGGNSTGGNISVASGTNLNLTGTHVFSGSYSGSIDGSVNLGTLQIAASGATFNFTGGGFKWSNGTITGPGILTNIGLFSISGSSLKDFTSGAIINNSGTVIWNGTGQIRGGGGQGSVFNNLAGGTFDIQVDATFNGTAFGGIPTAINNAGTFRKSAGAGTTTLNVTPFNNSGTVAIDTGIVSFSNGFTQQTSSSNVGITISGINAGTGFGQHRTTAGTTTLAGNLNVSLNNFTPAVGNSFQVMTFVNRNNTQFANINLPPLPPGRIWGLPIYTNTSLTLSVVAGAQQKVNQQE